MCKANWQTLIRTWMREMQTLLQTWEGAMRALLRTWSEDIGSWTKKVKLANFDNFLKRI